MTGRAAAGRGPGPAQKRRSAETQQAVVDATVDLLGEGGAGAVTAVSLAERSGVSWGGIQHQFGGKDGVLDAVLAWLAADLASRWELAEPIGGDLEHRVAALVRLVWRIVNDPSYRPLMALLAWRAERRSDGDPALVMLQEGARTTTQDLLAELDLDRATVDALHAFCFASLSGLVDQQLLAPASGRQTQRVLAIVEAGVLATIERGR